MTIKFFFVAVYYKAVADMTRFDLEDHRNDDVSA